MFKSEFAEFENFQKKDIDFYIFKKRVKTL